MTNQQEKGNAHLVVGQTSLRILLNNLVDNLTESIFYNKVVVQNKIEPELKMNVDKNRIAPVIDEVLHTVLSNARNTSIGITAERYADIVILNFEDPNNYNGYALQFSLALAGQSARHIGGDITIYGARTREATVSFSFPDSPAA